MTRRISILISAVFLLSGLARGATIKLLSSIPADHSEITSFDIKLKFDIEEAISELGNENIAIGYSGNQPGTSKYDLSTYLYEGSEESGKLIANVMTEGFNGSGDSKDCITFPFPIDLIPVPGQVYTLVCKNQFRLYELDTSKPIFSIPSIQYNKAPLVLTFTGAAPSSSELLIREVSIPENSDLASISAIEYEFNEDIAISQAKEVQIYNGENP